MHRRSANHLRSLGSSLLASIALTSLATSGCIEKRPRRGDREQAAVAEAEAERPALVVDAAAVDGSLDALVTGERSAVPVSIDDASEGAALPLVTIVEFSDFECPFCGRLASNLAGMVARYPDDVRLVFKQFPLQMHARAEPAARAAVAAGMQGAFWQMHDALFGDRRQLRDEDFTRYAKEMGIDVAKFNTDFAAPATRDRVNAELAQGQVLQVESTPTFFVNGRKITGAKDEAALIQIIDEERALAQKLLDAGAKRNELYARFMHAAAPGAGEAKAPPSPDHKRGEASAVANYAIGIGPGRATRGPDDAYVTIVVYADYGCADCQSSLQRIETVFALHPAVRASLRFGPLTDTGKPAATAVLAAGLQGKLWEAHRAMVELGRAVDVDTVRAKMKTLELDMTKLEEDMKSPRVAAMLAEDLGVVDVVRGTAAAPLYFVNGRFLGTTANPSEFDTLIVEETRKAEAFIGSERITRLEGFEKMRETWRGYKLVEAVPKADPPAAAPPAKPGEGPVTLGATPVLGDPKVAKLEIVACTDFDCPACARGAKNLASVREKYGDDVAITFRHLMAPGKEASEPAHLAAIAAGVQGKFWEMHDQLTRNRAARSDTAMEKLATAAGVDLARWNADRANPALRKRIEDDTAACTELGLTGLPSWKVGDEIILGSQPLDRFTKLIDKALAPAPK